MGRHWIPAAAIVVLVAAFGAYALKSIDKPSLKNEASDTSAAISAETPPRPQNSNSEVPPPPPPPRLKPDGLIEPVLRYAIPDAPTPDEPGGKPQGSTASASSSVITVQVLTEDKSAKSEPPPAPKFDVQDPVIPTMCNLLLTIPPKFNKGCEQKTP
jgi:hypothetical protein